jgi:hypothetical protein
VEWLKVKALSSNPSTTKLSKWEALGSNPSAAKKKKRLETVLNSELRKICLKGYLRNKDIHKERLHIFFLFLVLVWFSFFPLVLTFELSLMLARQVRYHLSYVPVPDTLFLFLPLNTTPYRGFYI